MGVDPALAGCGSSKFDPANPLRSCNVFTSSQRRGELLENAAIPEGLDKSRFSQGTRVALFSFEPEKCDLNSMPV